MTKTIVVVSGGMDPLHRGHLSYINESKKLGDYLIAGVNSDDWLTRKKGKPFMPWKERAAIVANLKAVDLVLPFDDKDGSARDLISQVCDMFPDETRYRILFTNGGDRKETNIPEQDYAYSRKVEFAFGIGGHDKINSSSEILRGWNESSRKND